MQSKVSREGNDRLGRKQVTLKHYDEYLRRLKQYTKASGIKLWIDDMESSYSPAARRLRLDTDAPQTHIIASFLHELGHSIDDTVVPKASKSLAKAYNAVYKEKNTPNQLRLVIECEKRAWDFGVKIAKILKIRLGKWYDDYRSECLKNYRD